MKFQYSYSRINLFCNCKLAFQFAHVQKIKGIKSDALIIGGAAHDVIAAYNRHLIAKELQTDLKRGNEFVDSLQGSITDEQYTEVRAIMDDFFDSHLIEPGLEKHFIESELAFDETWTRVEWMADNCFFRAKSDRSYIQNGIGYIHDYKTDRHLPAQSVIEKSFQLDIYAYILSLLYPDVQEFCIALDYVRYSTIRKTTRTKEYLQSVPKKIMRYVAVIENCKEFKPTVSSYCQWCEFKTLCWKYKQFSEKAEIKNIENFDQAKELAEKLYIAKTWAEDAEKLLKVWVENNYAIRLKDEVLDFHKVNKTSFPDVEATVAKLLGAGIDKGKIWDNLSLSKTAVEKILKQSKRTDIKDEIMALALEKPETHFKFEKAKE